MLEISICWFFDVNAHLDFWSLLTIIQARLHGKAHIDFVLNDEKATAVPKPLSKSRFFITVLFRKRSRLPLTGYLGI